MTIPQSSGILVMGVCGVGKSTLAERLSGALAGSFVEADLHHPPENVAAMRSGVPLDDDMRWGWLDRVAEAAESASPKPAVIACSALKRAYRARLRARLGRLPQVFLWGDRALLAERMAKREDHFMPATLLESQLADLEPPAADEAPTLAIDVALSRDDIFDRALAFASAVDAADAGARHFPTT